MTRRSALKLLGLMMIILKPDKIIQAQENVVQSQENLVQTGVSDFAFKELAPSSFYFREKGLKEVIIERPSGDVYTIPFKEVFDALCN